MDTLATCPRSVSRHPTGGQRDRSRRRRCQSTSEEKIALPMEQVIGLLKAIVKAQSHAKVCRRLRTDSHPLILSRSIITGTPGVFLGAEGHSSCEFGGRVTCLHKQ